MSKIILYNEIKQVIDALDGFIVSVFSMVNLRERSMRTS